MRELKDLKGKMSVADAKLQDMNKQLREEINKLKEKVFFLDHKYMSMSSAVSDQ